MTTNIKDSPQGITNHFETAGKTGERSRRASIHLEPSAGTRGEEGFWTRIGLSVYHDKDRRQYTAILSVDDHRTQDGIESVRFKIGKGAARILTIDAGPRFSRKQLEAAYTAAIAALREKPELITNALEDFNA